MRSTSLLKDGHRVVQSPATMARTRSRPCASSTGTTPRTTTSSLPPSSGSPGDMYKRRADLVGFVNGIPLVFIELKAAHKNLKNAFDYNLSDYKTGHPAALLVQRAIILSNGCESRVGSMTADGSTSPSGRRSARRGGRRWCRWRR